MAGMADATELPTCPCGSGRSYDDCCGRLHRGKAEATSAEELMRSRYTAFARRDADYLLRTWHPDHRPSRIDFPPDQKWTGLVVHEAKGGGMLDKEGTVEFTASHTVRGSLRKLHEVSRFTRVAGRWVYVAGTFDS